MSAPVLSSSERAAIQTVLTTVTLYQATHNRPQQAREAADLAAFGVDEALLDAALGLGFSGHVDEYRGPSGDGWCLVVRLVRDGVTWERTHHVGPEAWRARDWRVVTEGDPWPS